MLIQVSFKDDEADFSEPVYVGNDGKARDFLVDERILFKHEVAHLFKHGYTTHPDGEFYWEELND